jgi:hypothetical protein
MRSEIIAAANVNITAFWNVTSCSLVDRYGHLQRNMLPCILKMEAESFFKEHTTLYDVTSQVSVFMCIMEGRS